MYTILYLLCIITINLKKKKKKIYIFGGYFKNYLTKALLLLSLKLHLFGIPIKKCI